MSRKKREVKSGVSSYQPLAHLQWVPPGSLRANDYNPNRVFSPELELLRLSLAEDGWTQPIVARHDGEIVDGFHRWTLSQRFPELQVDGCVPVVFLEEKTSKEQQIMSTVRHNRARGQHGILKMSDIARSLVESGLEEAEICRRLGMEQEELDRLTDVRPSPQAAGKDSFGLGWVPTKD